jgi:hypothetical protein
MVEKYTFLGKSISKEPKSGMSITELNSFKINNSSSKTQHLEGRYFPVICKYHYVSGLQDYIGGYLQLKLMYPDLQIIFFNTVEDRNKTVFDRPHSELVFNDLVKHFNAKVIDIDNINYSFDSIVLNNAERPIIPKLLYSEIDDVPYEFIKETKIWRINSMVELLKEFSKYKVENNKKENIYITRSVINKIYKKSNHQYINSDRVHNFLYDENLDNIFINNNYSLTKFEEKSFFEQINIAYNSNIYITIEGSALWNSIWCNDNTKIINIKVNPNYIYYWNETLAAANKKIFKTIDVSGLSPIDGIKLITDEIKNI